MSSAPPPTDPVRKPEDESLGDLLSQVTDDMSTLIRQEIALAKAELTASAQNAGKGAGMFGGAGVAGHFVLLFLSIALWVAIGASAVGYAWSAVIIAVVWAIVAAILALLGKKNFDNVQGAPQTAETLQDVPDAVTPTKEAR